MSWIKNQKQILLCVVISGLFCSGLSFFSLNQGKARVERQMLNLSRQIRDQVKVLVAQAPGRLGSEREIQLQWAVDLLNVGVPGRPLQIYLMTDSRFAGASGGNLAEFYEFSETSKFDYAVGLFPKEKLGIRVVHSVQPALFLGMTETWQSDLLIFLTFVFFSVLVGLVFKDWENRNRIFAYVGVHLWVRDAKAGLTDLAKSVRNLVEESKGLIQSGQEKNEERVRLLDSISQTTLSLSSQWQNLKKLESALEEDSLEEASRADEEQVVGPTLDRPTSRVSQPSFFQDKS